MIFTRTGTAWNNLHSWLLDQIMCVARRAQEIQNNIWGCDGPSNDIN